MSVLPKSQVPDKSAVFHLVACFCERASVSDQNLFCHPTMVNDVSVGNIRHSLVQSKLRLWDFPITVCVGTHIHHTC